MDVPQLDDKMEIGTSPWPHVDDIDLDFDEVRQPSVDRSMADDLEPTGTSTDPMQADTDDPYNDDDMLDDDSINHPYSPNDDLADFNMDSYNPAAENYSAGDHDEEILYDEEEKEPVDMASSINHANDTTQNEIQIVDDHHSEPWEEVEKSKTEDDIENVTNKSTEIKQPPAQTSQPVLISPESQPSQTDAQTDLTAASETQVVDFANQENAEFHDHGLENIQADHSEEGTESNEDIQDIDRQSVNTEHEREQPQTLPAASPTADAAPEQEDITPRLGEQDLSRSSDLIHPVTVVYMGQEMSLFPPMVDDASATFFVSDHTLAYEPIDKLLASCREILGDSLEHDDELMLDISSLGLHICEDSKYASQITLLQIIETYLSLSRNENTPNIEPLYCSLSSRVCLASQYAYLIACATEGKTYSEIAAEYADTPEHEAASFNGEVGLDEPYIGIENTVAEDAEAENDELEISGKTSSNDVVRTGPVYSVKDQDPQTSETTPVVTRRELQHDEITTAAKHAGGQSEGRFNRSSDPLIGSPSQSQVQPISEASVVIAHNVNKSSVDGERVNVVKDSADTIPQEGENIDTEENASVSSHTVEGEINAASDDEHDLDFDNVNDGDNIDNVEHPQQEPHDESENYDYPEDLFKEESNEFDASQDDPNEFEDSAEADDPNEAVGHKTQDDSHTNDDDNAEYEQLTFDDTDGNLDVDENPGIDESTNELDILEVSDVTVGQPSTPSKLSSSKRKVSDDDDLDILNTSTPEPKRTRAS